MFLWEIIQTKLSIGIVFHLKNSFNNVWHILKVGKILLNLKVWTCQQNLQVQCRIVEQQTSYNFLDNLWSSMKYTTKNSP